MSAKEVEIQALSSVKGGAVTKPSQTSKSQSKALAKQVAAKSEKLDKKSKKAKKEPTPVPSSDESESDSDEGMSSASSGSSDEEATATGAKANGMVTSSVSKAIENDTSDSSDSSEDDSKAVALARGAAIDSEDDSEDDSDEDNEVERVKPTQAPVDADSGDDSSEDDDGPLEARGAVDAKTLNGKLEKVASKEASAAASSDESDDVSASDSDSDSGDEEEDEQGAEPAPSKKRKAETEPAPVAKKPKADAMAASFDDMAKANLFIGNLSWNVDEDWLVREFEQFGEIKSTKIVTDRETGRSRGFGYVEFVNYADGIKAHGEMKEAIIDGRTVNLDFAGPKKEKAGGDFQDRSKKYGDQTNPPSTTIFCANLAFGSTQDDVSEAFGEHAEIKAVRIPTDPGTGQMKGFAYVEFNSMEDATAAFDAMRGATINGRPIRVDYATTGGVNSGRGRGRGGSDRGGRGGDRGGRGGRGRGGFDRGGGRGGRGGSTNRGGFGDFKGKKMTF
ncbi:MAG: hypothetical protein Q9202_005939 [Teloschistes flavicans]